MSYQMPRFVSARRYWAAKSAQAAVHGNLLAAVKSGDISPLPSDTASKTTEPGSSVRSDRIKVRPRARNVIRKLGKYKEQAMRRSWRFTCSIVLAALSVSVAYAAAPVGRGMSWGSIAKLPDWTTGVWRFPLVPEQLERLGWPKIKNPMPELTPEFSKRFDAAKIVANQVASTKKCTPPGMPGIMRMPYPYQFAFAPGQVIIIGEAYMQVRFIYTDGRKHPTGDDLNPTFNGNSIGHWEGDTLVVDTVGMKSYTPLTSESAPDSAPVRVDHSDEMHIIERIHLAASNRLEIQTTVIDPKALVRPWVTMAAYERRPDWAIDEYVCEENPQDYSSNLFQ